MEKAVQDRIQAIIENSFLEPYLNIDTVTDISYNGTQLRIQDNVKGRYEAEKHPSQHEVLSLGKKIADEMGKEFTDTDPILDTELAYLRVNFIHSSISPSGCTFAIRVSKPRLAIKSVKEIANEDVEQLLKVLIKADTNILISGKTGAGKTELQKLLVGFIPDIKKVSLIEDTMDSHIKTIYPSKDINSWRILTEDTREKKIYYSDLIRAGLRNNPNWLIVAETRDSDAAYYMLESALTNHSIITTLHAKGAKMIPTRLMSMIRQKYPMNELLLGQDITSVLKFGIHMGLDETEHGIKRYIKEIVEYTGYDERGVSYTPIYEVIKEFNEKTGMYERKIITNALSNETLNDLQYKSLYHNLPEIFRKKHTIKELNKLQFSREGIAVSN